MSTTAAPAFGLPGEAERGIPMDCRVKPGNDVEDLKSAKIRKNSSCPDLIRASRATGD